MCSVSPGRASISGEVRQPLYVRSSSVSVVWSVGLLIFAVTRRSGRSRKTSRVPALSRAGPGLQVEAFASAPSVRGAVRPVVNCGTAANAGLALEACADADGGLETPATTATAGTSARAPSSMARRSAGVVGEYRDNGIADTPGNLQ